MKTIKVLLTENVNDLGIVGDVVNVKPGYARNFLVPRGIATDPTEGNIRRLAQKRLQADQEIKLRRAQQEELIQKLEGHEITMLRSANEQGVLFGGVSGSDIAEMLVQDGFPIDERAVRLSEQIKRLDSYEVPIVLAEDLKTSIKLWVVSDKPTEELETSDEGTESTGAQSEDETEGQPESEEEAIAR